MANIHTDTESMYRSYVYKFFLLASDLAAAVSK